MAQATAALITNPPFLASIANDDFGQTEGEKWRWLIEKFKTIHMPLAVFAAQEKLAGQSVYVFCDRLIAVFGSMR